MALDAVAHHSASLNTIFSDSASAYEDAFDRFAAWCAKTAACALHGRDVPALFDGLVARADQQPIPAPGCADGTCRPAVTGGEIRMNAFNWLLVKAGVPAVGLPTWEDFAEALVRAEHGDASAFASPRLPSPEDFAFSGIAINCLDYPFWARASDYDTFMAKTQLGRVLAPHTQGASEAWLGMLGCMRWPVAPNPPHRLAVHGAPPILLVSSTHDPSTAHVWAHQMRDRIDGSVLLTRDGDGHASSWLAGGRTRDAIARYLLTGETPPANTVLPD
jgi:hypothetical protein